LAFPPPLSFTLLIYLSPPGLTLPLPACYSHPSSIPTLSPPLPPSLYLRQFCSRYPPRTFLLFQVFLSHIFLDYHSDKFSLLYAFSPGYSLSLCHLMKMKVSYFFLNPPPPLVILPGCIHSFPSASNTGARFFFPP